MRGAYHHAQAFSIEMGSHRLFFFLLPRLTWNLLISACEVARITGLSHYTQPRHSFPYKKKNGGFALENLFGSLSGSFCFMAGMAVVMLMKDHKILELEDEILNPGSYLHSLVTLSKSLTFSELSSTSEKCE
jgi:hypothetical protein